MKNQNSILIDSIASTFGPFSNLSFVTLFFNLKKKRNQYYEEFWKRKQLSDIFEKWNYSKTKKFQLRIAPIIETEDRG